MAIALSIRRVRTIRLDAEIWNRYRRCTHIEPPQRPGRPAHRHTNRHRSRAQVPQLLQSLVDQPMTVPQHGSHPEILKFDNILAIGPVSRRMQHAQTGVGVRFAADPQMAVASTSQRDSRSNPCDVPNGQFHRNMFLGSGEMKHKRSRTTWMGPFPEADHRGSSVPWVRCVDLAWSLGRHSEAKCCPEHRSSLELAEGTAPAVLPRLPRVSRSFSDTGGHS